MKRKLTTKFIEGQKPDPSKRLDFRDELMAGLVLRISTSGTKTFCLHKRINGKMRRLTIGRFPVLSLAETRERVRQVLYEIETGRFEDRTGIEVETKPTLGDVIPDYIEKHAKVHNRDWKRKEALLAKFTILHGKQIDEIKRADVVQACDVIGKSAPVSANRALAHLKHLMSWCVESGIMDASPISGMKPRAKEQPRERVLTDDELGALWAVCGDEGYPFGDCMKLLILSGQRRAEVAEMRWSELDLEKRLWTLPSQRAKNGKQHTVPITDAMLEVLRKTPRFFNSDYVFTTTGKSPASGFGRVKERLDKALPDGTEPWIIHDLRRTMSTNMAMLGVPQPVTEALLNHKTGVVSGVAAIYNVYSYADEKREALGKWNQHLGSMLAKREEASCQGTTTMTQPRKREHAS
ncbi:tyrosine-type recombinase/integrase [Aliiroseovarius sp. Z3]|uniref:tyrosine-type recombinase/integrase n=1 Tax=Aliiroseovarius sp. Z3 TaxID=2811402 RepID=UPI0023B2E9C8|nr:site-specific integrase [Aliiroseovarius sp. Z3]MDE9449918.1 tyrosine-type recombinase/integrase [Aliiroseovarius sp. Z3]